LGIKTIIKKEHFYISRYLSLKPYNIVKNSRQLSVILEDNGSLVQELHYGYILAFGGTFQLKTISQIFLFV